MSYLKSNRSIFRDCSERRAIPYEGTPDYFKPPQNDVETWYTRAMQLFVIYSV